MRAAHKLALIAVCATFAFILTLFVLGNAQAASVDSKGSCADVQIMIAGPNARAFRVWNNEAGGSGRCNQGSPKTVAEVEPLGSIDLHCLETPSGIAPPDPPTANGIIIRGYADNNGFPDGATFIWSQTYTSCLTQQDFTIFCTNNGLVGGSPVTGTIRLYIRAQRTTVITYDDSSDSATDNNNDGSYGIYRCKAHADTLLDVNASTGIQPSIYFGNDPYRTRFNISQGTDVRATNWAQIDLNCGSGAAVVTASFRPSATLANFDKTLSESNNTFPDQCTIIQKITINLKSQVSGFTAEDYSHWTTINPCSGCTVSATVVQKSTLPRTIFYNGFTVTNLDDSQNPPVNNLSAFLIANEQQFLKVNNLRNPRDEMSNAVSGSCDRKKPDFSLQDTKSLGLSDSSGNYAATNDWVPTLPAGQWSFNCTFTAAPNIGFYNVTFVYLKSFAANLTAGINWNVTANGSNQTWFDINITVVLRKYEPMTDSPVALTPDGNVRLTVWSFNHSVIESSYLTKIVNREIMNRLDGPITQAYWFNFSAHLNNLTGAQADVQFNASGAPLLFSQGYHLNWAPSATNTLGNFTGNFTGNVTDLAAAPAIVTTSILEMGLIIAPFLIIVFNRNIFVYLIGFFLELVAGILAFDADVQAKLPSELITPIIIVTLGSMIFFIVLLAMKGWEMLSEKEDSIYQ